MTNFVRTLIQVEILTKGEYHVPDSLALVEEDFTTGHASGDWTVVSSEEVSPKKMRELLEAQGTDPTFLAGELCGHDCPTCGAGVESDEYPEVEGEGVDAWCAECDRMFTLVRGEPGELILSSRRE